MKRGINGNEWPLRLGTVNFFTYTPLVELAHAQAIGQLFRTSFLQPLSIDTLFVISAPNLQL